MVIGAKIIMFKRLLLYTLIVIGLEINPNQELMHTVLPHLFDLAQLTGSGNARRCMAAILSEKYEEWFTSGCKKFPGHETVSIW